MPEEPRPIAPPPQVAAALARVGDELAGFGEPFFYYAEVGSTNDLAARLAAGGAPEGTTVVAAAQTAGRGRMGRAWHSPPGAGLYVSVLFGGRSGADAGSPASPPGRGTSLLTLMAGVALAEGVERATGLRADLKWPNDLVVEPPGVPWRGRRKLAGILAEAISDAGGLVSVVLGFGINLRPAALPPELADRVTSLEGELGHRVDGAVVLAECLAALGRWRRALRAGGAAHLLERWRTRGAPSFGREVEWREGGRTLRGVTRQLDEAGALVVERAGGRHAILSGEVTWL